MQYHTTTDLELFLIFLNNNLFFQIIKTKMAVIELPNVTSIYTLNYRSTVAYVKVLTVEEIRNCSHTLPTRTNKSKFN